MVLSRPFSDPFSELRRLQSEVNRLFQTATPQAGGVFPYLNVYASQDAVLITAELPGVSPENLDINVHRDTLTLRGERKGIDEGKAKGHHRRERRTGRFVRTLSLPFPVDTEQVEAGLQDGMLRLKLHRPESDKPKRIQLKTS